MAETLFNSEAETAILSLMLCNPAERLEYNGLKPQMFSSSVNEEIFRTIEELRDADTNPDVNFIIMKLKEDGKLDKVGGEKYLNALRDNYNFDKQNFSEYVRTVCNYYKTRGVGNLVSGIKIDKINPGDIDDVILSFRNKLDSLQLESAHATTIHIGEQMKQAYDEITSREQHRGLRGSSWGVKPIDDVTAGKVAGELWYIGGRPSQGKSALMLNSVLADGKAGVPVLIFSREMNYQSLVERMISIETGISLTNIRSGVLDTDQLKLILDCMSVLKNYPIYIDVDFTSTSPAYIEATISKYKRLHDIKVVYVDYIQLLSERNEDQTAELGRFSRMFKALTNKYDLSIIVISQLNRQVEMRENKRPILSDLRQSGNLEEDADFVVGLYRDSYYNKETKDKDKMEFIILKARNAQIGTVTVDFIDSTNKVKEAR